MGLSANVKEKADLIWAIADKLTGVYKPHEYGDAILPLTIIRRFDCALEDTKKKVLKKNGSSWKSSYEGYFFMQRIRILIL